MSVSRNAETVVRRLRAAAPASGPKGTAPYGVSSERSSASRPLQPCGSAALLPKLPALALLDHAIHVARIALLAQHVGLLHPHAPTQREPQPSGLLTTAFFARSYDLAVVIRRYRAAVANAAAGLDASLDQRDPACRPDDDL